MDESVALTVADSATSFWMRRSSPRPVSESAGSGQVCFCGRVPLGRNCGPFAVYRRLEARDALRAAHALFTAMGAEGFAEQARGELVAAGDQARSVTVGVMEVLTGQELNIARLVATGAPSREVADRLFLSPRTIDAHLRSVFKKLDITSRRQLAAVLGQAT